MMKVPSHGALHAVARSVLLVVLGAACGRLSAGEDPEQPGAGGSAGPPVAAVHPSVGLASVVPGRDSLRVEWEAQHVDEVDLRIGLFVSEDAGTLFEAIPIELDQTTGARILESLAEETEYFVGIGVCEGGGSTFTPIGPVLRATTGSPVYVDSEADPAGADGQTPETAFADPFLGMLTALSHGGGNVWVSGTFSDVSLSVFEGVHLFGGFPRGFDLSSRDVTASPTVFRGRPGRSIVILEGSSDVRVIDGLVLDGVHEATDGVDLDGADAELRAVVAVRCGRGARLRAEESLPPVDVELTACEFSNNTVDGLTLHGAFEVTFDKCRFLSNAQEGVDADDLVAPNGGEVELVARDCLFAGNGIEGLDVDLVAPASGGSPGGRFRVAVEDCEFEQNGSSGLLVDLDYEAHPEWSADLVIRGCHSRANQGDGFRFDLDARAQVLLHRVLASANGADGLAAASESRAGTVVVSSSAFLGNLGAGVRSSGGNFGVVLTHGVLAGNQAGGLRAELVPATAISSVAHLQPAPWSGAVVVGCLVVDDATLPVFENAPVSYSRVIGASGASLSLASLPSFGIGALCELADDTVARRSQSVGAASVVLDPEAAQLLLPAILTHFPSGDSVEESLAPTSGSPLIGAGLALPSGPAVDIGPFGAPSGGVPGEERLVGEPLFAVGGSAPSWTGVLSAEAELRIAFLGGTPDGSSVVGNVFAVDEGGRVRSSVPFVDGDEVVLTAPEGGWRTGDRVQMYPGLAATDGRRMPATVVLALRVD